MCTPDIGSCHFQINFQFLCFSSSSTQNVVSQSVLPPLGSALHWQQCLLSPRTTLQKELLWLLTICTGNSCLLHSVNSDPCFPPKTKSGSFFLISVSDVNSKGGTFLDLIARFCTESAKAAYGTNTGIIMCVGTEQAKEHQEVSSAGGWKRETDKAGRRWGQTILVQLCSYKHLIIWTDSEHTISFSFFRTLGKQM